MEVWENTGAPDLELVYAEERTYDAVGNVLTYTEAVGFSEERTTTYEYDELSRLIAIIVPSVVNPNQDKVTSFDYDDNDNLRSRTEQGLLGEGTPFTYVTSYTHTTRAVRSSPSMVPARTSPTSPPTPTIPRGTSNRLRSLSFIFDAPSFWEAVILASYSQRR
jgi:YD repeat-containing protein